MDESGQPNLCILSPPRVGSSFVASLVQRDDPDLIDKKLFPDLEIVRNNSEFNPKGYFEEVGLNLMLDQMIRRRFGPYSSFLNNSSMLHGLEPDFDHDDREFDLDGRVEVPLDYAHRIEHYTGRPWDIWGLSRMAEGQKWHRAYSRAGVASFSKAEEKWSLLKGLLVSAVLKPIKDPRLLYLANELPDTVRIITIRREPKDLLASMRSHYGPRMFTAIPFSGFGWVSNHFNYRVAPQAFDEYLAISERYLGMAEERFESVSLRTEHISDKRTQRLVRNFAHAS